MALLCSCCGLVLHTCRCQVQNSWSPDQEDIAARCAEIQRTWSPSTEELRIDPHYQRAPLLPPHAHITSDRIRRFMRDKE
jgi:hypothetical protein